MKTIKEVLIESFGNLDRDNRRNLLLEEMNEFFDNDIPQDIIEKFQQESYVDYIWENLQTHDYRLLKKQLTKYFSKDIEEYVNQKDADKNDIFLIKARNSNLHKDPKFQSLLQFFNYFIREIRGNSYTIEPIYSTKMNDWVYGDCNQVVYHFTDSKSAESILKNGLRIKGRNLDHWKYPERIYLYAPGYYLSTDNINDWIGDAMDVTDLSKGNLVVLKIDLHKTNKTNIDFYKDPAMHEKAIFTYNNIPKECITKLNF